ncbi:MAG: NAD(P)/FAD-dependent oxidoreductase [Chloroflexi bacterium]|nr:NAD(P)/FAD-dependent oxidoreductase [Chloroflexota bacterium]
MLKYVVVGNSAGGIAAVEAIRSRDKEGTLALVSDEPYPAYSRPLISKYLAGETTQAGMAYRSPDFYDGNAVETHLGKKAVRLDLEGRKLQLAGGAELSWEKLLLATGGTPIVPRMEGLDKTGVYTFTTLDDARKLEEGLEPCGRVVVIGGGLIGMSVTEALVKRGVQVTVVELLDRVLATLLDLEASRAVEVVLRRKGVEVLTGQTVQTILGSPEGQDRVGGVLLKDGREVPCCAVIVAVGVSPRLDLVKGTTIATNRGIIVDRHMATNVPGIYACGDVAEGYDFTTGGNRVVPVWPSAYLGGRVAGYNMAGGSVTYPGAAPMNAFNYFGMAIVCAGLINPPAGGGYQVLVSGSAEEGSYKKLVLKDGKLAGILFFGDIERSGILFGLMREGLQVSGLGEDLFFPKLMHLPEDLRVGRIEEPGWRLAATRS